MHPRITDKMNIRLIESCNPFRKRKGNEEKYGLNLSNENELCKFC